MPIRAALSLMLATALAGCSGEPAPPADPAPRVQPDPLATPAALPPQAGDFPALASRDCEAVARFYFEAIAEGAFDRAALAWDDPVIDGARLRALFGGIRQPRFTVAAVHEEGAAGSLYCTIEGALTDAADPARPPRTGTIELRRVNDVPGATPDQLRWTIRRSTFVEPMERAGRGGPA
ncbi:MAG: hypothetical protein H5U21_10095 [Porphyrobacter sp.]|nr:hypothetical protein [Porphyrobacter sp.]